MKAIATSLFFSLFVINSLFAQHIEVYDDFEGKRLVNYASRTGDLDSAAANPLPNEVNSSAHCAKYLRNNDKKFDVLKMTPFALLSDVSAFATYLGVPPRLRLKVYTTAPVGTLVEILLGSKEQMTAYPEGTHSQYQAFTTVTNAWEELTFKFSQMPAGSEVKNESVNLITILFNPNSLTADTWYFDDLTGPAVKTAATTQESVPAGGTK